MKNIQKYDKQNLKKIKLLKNKYEIFSLRPISITEKEFKRLEKKSKPTEALKKLINDDN